MTINKVILVGNVGNDPQISTANSNGGVVARISVATTEKWKDQQGQLQEKTEWHRVVFFGRTAEIVRDYVVKGSQVYIEGRLQTSKYTDKEGIERYSTDVIGAILKMLGRKGSNSAESSTPSYNANSQTNPQNTPPKPNPTPMPTDSLDAGDDDNTPF